MNLSRVLQQWYSINKRELPFRSTDNPYFIWLSEIILQQTRVEQGLPFYLNFTKTFPKISDLASAEERQVLKLWQGLGYYSRARNLHYSAKYIVKKYNGVFPDKYEKILDLKGVGPYTAAAISSFAFGLPYAVVDGNVIRVLSRFFGIETAFDSAAGKKEYQRLAQSLLDRSNPAENNQAIMDFGALQCLPAIPRCPSCPLVADCIAYNTNSVKNLPVRSKRVKVRSRFIHYLLIQNDDCLPLVKREKGIWKGLYEFPSLEFSTNKPDRLIMSSEIWNIFFESLDYKIESVSEQIHHKLSHQHIYAKFWTIKLLNSSLEGYLLVRNSELKSYPVPRLIDKFLKENGIV